MEQLDVLLQGEKDLFLLGGGSNMLLVKPIKKLVVHMATKGITVINKDEKFVYVEVQAGENWHEFVMWCVDHNYGGVENLALIPGNVGTSPIQNIGAYGVEVKDTIDHVKAVAIASGEEMVFTNEDCKFGYRSSIFKSEYAGKLILTSVVFRLTHTHHNINDSYGAIRAMLTKDKSIKAIADAVMTIRSGKLPDPKKIGNSGSFFKNPVIPKDDFEKLVKKHSSIPNYPVNGKPEWVKIAAGWLIDQCGLKGYRVGDAGVHKNQALVLVNYGNATGAEILALAHYIQNEVKKNFFISLEMEVNIIGDN